MYYWDGDHTKPYETIQTIQDIFSIGEMSACVTQKPFGWVFAPKKKAGKVEVTNRAIVFCRDCEEYKEWDNTKICMRLGSYYGNMKPDDYCSYGVREDVNE